MNATFSSSPAFRKFGSILAAAIIMMTMFLGFSNSASAASYVCCVDVQADAAARTSPEVAYNFAGYVNPDNWFASTQKSLVKCYADGGWATGNYRTNRWFLVYVSTSYGYTNWFYVHASYVYNQKVVPRC